MYLERLTAFNYDIKYYKPRGVFNTTGEFDEYQIPNCTAYAFLRAHEIAEETKRQAKWIRQEGGFGEAKNWYKSDGTLPRSLTPTNGCIAVFNGNAGHVCIIERIIKQNGNGYDVVISESNYDANKSRRDWKFFRSRQVYLEVGKSTLSGIGALIGFILVPTNDKRVSKDPNKYQVEITETYVNVRKTPNGELVSKGCYCPMGIYDVLDTQKVQEYTWYKLDKDCWIREGSWLKEYLSEINQPNYKTLYEQNQQKIERIIEILQGECE